MHLESLDWWIVGAYIVITFLLGIAFAKKASGDTEDFFLAGRKLPWYLVGTSMVATTLAADTPIGVAELVRNGGLSGVWYGWAMAIGTVVATVFYSRLWRRSGVTTDAEIVSLRYDGVGATVLRVTRATYLSLIINCLVLGNVMFAMSTVIEALIGLDKSLTLIALLLLALIYSTAAGFWGVVATDAMQFVVAMSGTIVFAWVVVDEAGGMGEMMRVLERKEGMTNVIPRQTSPLLPFETFCAYVMLQWWGQRNADGGEYLGQRLFAARSSRDAQLGMLFYAALEFVIKLWPLIIIGLASVVLMPTLEGETKAFPELIARYAPAGLRGLLVASLLAAFMSTVDTHLNWGASYLVNDLYRAYIKKDASNKHYVFASRLAMVFLGVLAALLSLLFTSISEGWMLILALGAGQGLVVLLRWYWWRINAWSELSAMLASALATVVVYQVFDESQYALRIGSIVGFSALVWLSVTFLTPPVSEERLRSFYEKVRPRIGFWGPLQRDHQGEQQLFTPWLAFVAALVFVYGCTFGVGGLLLGQTLVGTLALAVGVLSLPLLFQLLREPEDREDPTR